MKLLVFAHTPPPHHGQSYMVKVMLEGFGGDQSREVKDVGLHGIQCFHVNARVSRGLDDIGEIRFGKLPILLAHCMQAVWYRLRHGVKTMYYVPAPARRSALIRDWIVMALCRPFFPRIVYHWHAAGMGNWLVNEATPLMRTITRGLCGNVSLSIVLSNYNKTDAEALNPQRITLVPNGISDPCPEFEQVVLPRRKARAEVRRRRLEGRPPDVDGISATGADSDTVHVLFLANCSREKGLFDTIEGVRLANEALERRNTPLRLSLHVVGSFMNPAERVEFDDVCRRIGAEKWLKFSGFLSGEDKYRAFLDADVFCFPSYHHAENLSLVLLEAMSFGLPIVTTRWRSLPEIFRPGSSGLVEPRNPAQVSEALIQSLSVDSARDTRDWFLQHFTLDRHLANMAQAIKSVEHGGDHA